MLVDMAKTMLQRARGRLMQGEFAASLAAAGDAVVVARGIPAGGEHRAQLLYEAHEASAAALEQLGKFQEALDQCALAVAAAKDVAVEKPLRLLDLRERRMRLKLGEEHRNAGNVFYKRGIYESALAAYDAAATADPACSLAPSNAAAALLKLERWADAAAAATRALSLDSKNFKALWRRAAAYEQLGRRADAYVDLVAVAGSDTDDAAGADGRRVAKDAMRRAERLLAAMHVLASGEEVRAAAAPWSAHEAAAIGHLSALKGRPAGLGAAPDLGAAPPDLGAAPDPRAAPVLCRRCAKTTRTRKHKKFQL